MVTQEILEAAELGDISALERFQNEVTEELSDSTGANCLHYAARQNGCDVLSFLVKRRGFSGKKRSNIGSTPAHDAAAAGNLEAVKWLLENTGCQVDDQDGTGATMLHLACRFQHTHVTEWLVDDGDCDVMLRTASGALALHFAVVGGDFEAVKILTDAAPKSVNFQTSNGASAVYLAAQEGQCEILELLVQNRRGNAKIKAYDGMSSLHAASQSGHMDCVRFLVQDENCNPNERDFDGATPLHYAASRGQFKVLDWLLREGRAKIMLDNIGGSPLHNAAETGQIRCIKILLDNGCSPDFTDNNGLTAAELARKCHHDSCADLIQSYISQDFQDPDYDYLQQVQSPRPQLINNYLSNYNGVPEPPRATSPSGHPVVIATSRPQTPPLLAPTSSPRTPGTPKQHPDPDYSDIKTEKHQTQLENLFLLKSPTRRLTEYLREPEPELVNPSEPVKYPAPDEDSTAVQIYQPADVIVRPPSPEVDYSFREFNPHTPGNLDVDQIKSQETGESESVSSHVSAYADSNEFLEGNRRSVSELDLIDRPPSLSSSVSSLSDHSHLDDLVAFTTAAIQGQSQPVGKVGRPEPLSYQTGNSVNQQSGSSKGFEKASTVPVRSFDVKGGYGHLAFERQLSDKRVSFDGLENDRIDFDAETGSQKSMDRPPSEYLTREVVIEEAKDRASDKNDFKQENSPKQNAVNSSQRKGSVNSDAQLNGNASGINIVVNSASRVQDTAKTVSAPPVVNNVSKLEDTSMTVSAPPTAPPPPPIPSPGNTDASPTIANGHHVPPPPPPPVPTSAAPPAPQLVNGVTPSVTSGTDNSNQTARPTSLFSQETIAAKLNSLNHTSQNPSSAASPMANTDFIEELKLATKSCSLRRTSRAGESPGATMVFSSANGPVPLVNGVAEKPKQENGTKADLTGEFDPKNFVDKVPNKDNLPSWKVQMMARQLAEKTMKETLEQRKVEAAENRFKNMPAWKRALVEKKEAEARALEEKRQQEAEHKVVNSKRVPTISVQSAGGNLAPWQRELQGNN